jgi:hypothetical protein
MPVLPDALLLNNHFLNCATVFYSISNRIVLLSSKYGRAQNYQIFPSLNAKFGGVPRTNPHQMELHQRDVKDL